jgi:hypothetical protein
MLDEATRTAIFKLHEQGHGSRAIAQALKVARATVRQVIRSGHRTVPPLLRAERCEPWREQILELHAQYQGHLGRVYEELLKGGASLSYPALTASVVLCYSRMIFFQMYPRFTRFECKAFLTQALTYFNGAAATCMIDNSHVIVAAGTGAAMIPAPEMAAFAECYGFTFIAHEKGDANRSARVEAPFHRIERGFLAGTQFRDWTDLNTKAIETCEAWNAKFSNKLHASRRELLAAERPALIPLPLHIPEVYQIFTRIVDAEGYVHINRLRYSVPYTLIGRTLEVRETIERIDLYEGPRRVATHARVQRALDTRVTDPIHRPPRGFGHQLRPQPAPEEIELLTLEPQLAGYVAALKLAVGSRRLPLRRLLSMLRDYPRAAFLSALMLAEQYRLFDLDRLERMVLKQIAREYFVLTPTDESDE